MAGSSTSPISTVLIAIGPEWNPVRRIVQTWTTAHVFSSPTAIAVLDATPSCPAGRVARWIAGERDATLYMPGEAFANDAGGIWCGVTELLLDPDPSQAEQLYAIGLWTRYASRIERLKMRVSPVLYDDIVAQAARFAPALSVLVGEWQGQRVVIAGRDLIAVEVTARAFRSHAQPAGDVGLSPWQTPIVQSAIERGMGAAGGQRMQITLQAGSPIDPRIERESADLIDRICSTLDTSRAS